MPSNGFSRKARLSRPYVRITGNVPKHCGTGMSLPQKRPLHAERNMRCYSMIWKGKYCRVWMNLDEKKMKPVDFRKLIL
jgi:hypothetical protein